MRSPTEPSLFGVMLFDTKKLTFKVLRHQLSKEDADAVRKQLVGIGEPAYMFPNSNYSSPSHSGDAAKCDGCKSDAGNVVNDMKNRNGNEKHRDQR
jgi:hypothetical protein